MDIVTVGLLYSFILRTCVAHLLCSLPHVEHYKQSSQPNIYTGIKQVQYNIISLVRYKSSVVSQGVNSCEVRGRFLDGIASELGLKGVFKLSE